MIYYKKSQVYSFLKSIYGDSMPKMKECDYSFYRGTEWLEFVISENYFTASVHGKLLRVVERKGYRGEIVSDVIHILD